MFYKISPVCQCYEENENNTQIGSHIHWKVSRKLKGIFNGSRSPYRRHIRERTFIWKIIHFVCFIENLKFISFAATTVQLGRDFRTKIV